MLSDFILYFCLYCSKIVLMLGNNCRKQIIALIKKEVVPAIGCTEPIAVALCVAKAKEVLGEIPTTVEVLLSANMLKNAMGVGIPSTNRTGLPIAIALGVVVGKSEYGLQVLKESTSSKVDEAVQFLESSNVNVALKGGNVDKLYIEVIVKSSRHTASVIIEKEHTRFTHIERDGVNIPISKEADNTLDSVNVENEVELSFRLIYDFALTTPIEEIEFIEEAAKLNKAAAEISFKENYGHGLGRMLNSHQEMIGSTLLSRTLSYTSAACDARMAGAMIPVMSNSGSGNQGISATLPVVIFAEENNIPRDKFIRALILSHLTVIYIKQNLGRLSALCGCVVAATGSSCGITYMMGGSYEQITYAVQNMVANITGMICDGAKPSCSLKVTTGASTALLSAMMAIDNKCVSCLEGIIDKDVDQTIKNLTRIGSEGMSKTDELVLDIMVNKC